MALSILVGALKTPAILQPIKKTILTRRTPIRNGCIFCRPVVDFLEKPSVIFSKDAISHHWGALPMIIICGIGFTLEVLAWIRIAATRDDVWYTKGAANCEVVETRKGYPPPIRKFKVYNQKYETPAGLLEALQGDTLGPSYNAGKPSSSRPNASDIAVHTAVTAGAVGLAMVML